MRFFRLAFVAPIALGALALMSSPASATVPIATQLSIGQPKLGRLGTSVSVPLTFTCDTSLNVAFGDVSVTQVSGHKLAGGSGSFQNDFPGVPCTGVPETITVQVTAFAPGFAYKNGNKALASADLSTFDPVSGDLVTTSIAGQSVTISK